MSDRPLRLTWPTDYARVTQPFDYPPTRLNYTRFGLPGHEGLDIQGPHGANVYAAFDGEVYRVEQGPDGNYGCQVRLVHQAQGAEWKTIYAHLVPGSAVVRAGERVRAGELLALSDSTGNSSGSHLHLTLKRTGATARGETTFPNDIVDPTPYLHWAGLRLRPRADLWLRDAAGRALAFVREGDDLVPARFHAETLAQMAWGPAWVAARAPNGVIGLAQAADLLVATVQEPEPPPAAPPPIPPALPGGFYAGVHGRADGAFQEPDYAAVARAGVGAVKITTNTSPATVTRLRQIDPDVFIVARLFEDFRAPGGQPRAISAQAFAEKFRPNPAGQQPTDFQRLYEQGIRYAEVHNEPNLTAEGFGPGGSWNSGAEFSAWFLEAIDRLRAWFPDALWGFPGLSPGAAIPAVRPQEMWDFLDQCGPAIAESDWLGVHQYFAGLAEMETGLEEIVAAYRRRWPDLLVMVTEFSNPLPTVTKGEKGAQYVSYYRELAKTPGVGAAFSFVLSASDPQFRAETWREEDGAHSAIIPQVRAWLWPGAPLLAADLAPGLHVISGPRDGYRQYLERCAAAGRPAGLVKAVGEGGALLEAKAVSPGTVTIYRTRLPGDTPPGNFTDNPYHVAEAWMDLHVPVWRANPADYYEPVNEPAPDTPDKWRWLGDFTIRCIEIAEGEGFALCLFNFAAGVPDYADFEFLAPALRRAAEGPHILGVHEYPLLGNGRVGDPANAALIYRYRRYHEIMAEHGVALRVAITEFAPCRGGHAWDACSGAETFVDDVLAYCNEVGRDDYVVGRPALFSLGQWEGHRSNYQEALPLLAARVEGGR